MQLNQLMQLMQLIKQQNNKSKRSHATTKTTAATTTTTTMKTISNRKTNAAICKFVATQLGFRITTTTTTLNRPHAAYCIWISCLLAVIFTPAKPTQAVGYSYTRFEGPVVGPEHKIIVPDAFGDGTRVDYVARPEYSFAYGVEDGKTRVLQNRKETRDGDEVRGVYSVVDPDGTLRVVKYTADDVHGFQAEVITNGVATLHGHGAGGSGGDGRGAGAGAGVEGGAAAIEQQVKHHENGDGVGDGHYEVHEDHNDANEHGDDTAAEDDDADDDDHAGAGEYEHAEYDGSSEEGFEEAHENSVENSEEY